MYNSKKLTIGGKIFEYQRLQPYSDWNAVPIHYLFCADGADGTALAAYAGETGNAQTRFPNHERWDDAVRLHGVTHVLACIAPRDETQRCKEEQAIIKFLNPPMNIQHKPQSYFGGMINTPPDYAARVLAAALNPPPPPRLGLGAALKAPSPDNRGLGAFTGFGDLGDETGALGGGLFGIGPGALPRKR